MAQAPTVRVVAAVQVGSCPVLRHLLHSSTPSRLAVGAQVDQVAFKAAMVQTQALALALSLPRLVAVAVAVQMPTICHHQDSLVVPAVPAAAAWDTQQVTLLPTEGRVLADKETREARDSLARRVPMRKAAAGAVARERLAQTRRAVPVATVATAPVGMAQLTPAAAAAVNVHQQGRREVVALVVAATEPKTIPGALLAAPTSAAAAVEAVQVTVSTVVKALSSSGTRSRESSWPTLPN